MVVRYATETVLRIEREVGSIDEPFGLMVDVPTLPDDLAALSPEAIAELPGAEEEEDDDGELTPRLRAYREAGSLLIGLRRAGCLLDPYDPSTRGFSTSPIRSSARP